MKKPQLEIFNFKITKLVYFHPFCSDEDLNGTLVNRHIYPYLNGMSNEHTLIISLNLP